MFRIFNIVYLAKGLFKLVYSRTVPVDKTLNIIKQKLENEVNLKERTSINTIIIDWTFNKYV